jgi:hypothetical protein
VCLGNGKLQKDRSILQQQEQVREALDGTRVDLTKEQNVLSLDCGHGHSSVYLSCVVLTQLSTSMCVLSYINYTSIKVVFSKVQTKSTLCIQWAITTVP